jgi:hypothetical protein
VTPLEAIRVADGPPPESHAEPVTPVFARAFRSARPTVAADDRAAAPIAEPMRHAPQPQSFASFWDFAVRINRADRAALDLAGAADVSSVPIDGSEVRKLLGTMWFRSVVPRLSQPWRDRVLEVVADHAPIPNHRLKIDGHGVLLSDVSHAQLSDLVKRTSLPENVRSDVDLLIVVGRLWGGDALRRFHFAEPPPDGERFRLGALLQGLRG